MPTDPTPPPTRNTSLAEAVRQAAASLAPNHTPHGHLPDWRRAAEDEADEQREHGA